MDGDIHPFQWFLLQFPPYIKSKAAKTLCQPVIYWELQDNLLC